MRGAAWAIAVALALAAAAHAITPNERGAIHSGIPAPITPTTSTAFGPDSNGQVGAWPAPVNSGLSVNAIDTAKTDCMSTGGR